ncbi:LacI family transcriptional regulator (plasmid) [Deinococcus psychrotolerans]|uniref:LacI family transcriptional regulator n=1 Tax=Deinococcus psychrotolerans TaxID=2489213 RepID=A0A3G8YS50_9DEIO|nr:LacI family DNA-binding transcriptional regulator [Deinococcus psychrotolerans]AZI44581.1 LacI family transcriptional regulator [Deinococcus psychrotolerans]
MTKPSVLDVARSAGVGASTVSRVLNNHPHISESAKARVLAAVEELGYTPNLSARSLRSGQTGAISVLLPMTGTAFYETLLSAVQAGLEAHDYDLALFPLLGERRFRRFRESGALLYHADALLIVSQSPDQLYAGRPPFNKPVVLLDAHHPHHHSISFDNPAAGRMAAELALSCGLPMVLLDVAEGPGDWPSPAFLERRGGVLETLSRRGVTPIQTLHAHTSPNYGREAAQQLIASGIRPPFFLLALSDDLALGASRQLLEAGWQAGRDYLLLGFDGSLEAAQAGMSSVAQPVSQMGGAAAETLLAALGGGLSTLTQRVFAPSLQERASTAASLILGSR